jgi:hypothetical protein
MSDTEYFESTGEWVVFDTENKKEYRVANFGAAVELAQKFNNPLMHDAEWWEKNKENALLRGFAEEDLSEALTAAQRMKRRSAMRKAKAKIQMGRRRAARRKPTRDVYIKRSERAARNIIFKKLASGKSKSDMSYAARLGIEKRMKGKGAAIKKLAKKLLPNLIKQDKAARAARAADAASANTSD